MKKIIASILMLMIISTSVFAYTGSTTVYTNGEKIMGQTTVSYSYYTVSGKSTITSIDRYASSFQFVSYLDRALYSLIWNPFSPCNSSYVTYLYSSDGRKIGFTLNIYGNLTISYKLGITSVVRALFTGNVYNIVMNLMKPFCSSSCVANYSVTKTVFS